MKSPQKHLQPYETHNKYNLTQLLNTYIYILLQLSKIELVAVQSWWKTFTSYVI